MCCYANRNHEEKDSPGEGGNKEKRRRGYGDPQQGDREGLYFQGKASPFPVVLDLLSKPAVGHEPVVEGIRTSGVARGSEQKEGDSGQKGQEDTNGSNRNKKGARNNQYQPDRSAMSHVF